MNPDDFRGKYPHMQSKPNLDFMNEVFSFDVTRLEQTDSVVISRYIVAVSQYLIYLQSSMNSLRAINYADKRYIESVIASQLTKDVLKQYSAKKDAVNSLIMSNPELMDIQAKIDTSTDELFLLEGIDKTLMELIASLKRELTRRDHERNYS